MTSHRSFYRFKHRSCLSDNAADCGDDRELTLFEECPQWLTWEAWSKCEADQEIPKTRSDDKNARYNTFKRFRQRFCNTGIEKVRSHFPVLYKYKEYFCETCPIPEYRVQS